MIAIHKLKFIFSDFAALWIIVAAGACCGFALNQVRDRPLPLVYASKAVRLQQAVERLSRGDLRPAVPTLQSSTDPAGPVMQYNGAAAVREIDLAGLREIVENRLGNSGK